LDATWAGSRGEIGELAVLPPLMLDPAGEGQRPRGGAVTIEVAPGGPPGVRENGTTNGERGYDGFAVAITRW